MSPRTRLLVLRNHAPARKPWAPLAWAAAALALDVFALWLCRSYAPARFDTDLSVIIRQFPDVGVFLVPVLALAILWPVPRTVWLLLGMRARPSALRGDRNSWAAAQATAAPDKSAAVELLSWRL